MWEEYLQTAGDLLHGSQTTTTTTTEKPGELNPVVVILGIIIVVGISIALFKSSK